MRGQNLRNRILCGLFAGLPGRMIITLLLIAVTAGCAAPRHLERAASGFQEFTLKNGIPVIVKISTHNSINALSLALKGGGSYVPRDLAGIEEMTLALALYESENFTNIAKRTILKETSAMISQSVGLDYSTYDLKTIDRYFPKTFELYADLLINPKFSEEHYKEVKTNMINRYRSRLTDGFSRVSLAINREFLKDHPYEAALADLRTYEKIALEDIRKYHRDNIVAARMLLVAVGNYDVPDLRMKLEAAFGSLPRGEYNAPILNHFTAERSIPLILDPTEHLREDVSFVRCNLVGPGFDSDEYWATVVAFRMLNDILFDQIRTKRGLVYSMFSFSLGKIANYSQIGAYRTGSPEKIMDLVDTSINMLAEGKCLAPNVSSSAAGKGQIGSAAPEAGARPADYINIGAALRFYKASFQTEYFQGLEANLPIAGSIIEYELKTGDYRNYMKTVHKIEQISSADIVEATKDFIKKPAKYCAVSANPVTIKALEESHASYAPEYKKVVLE